MAVRNTWGGVFETRSTGDTVKDARRATKGEKNTNVGLWYRARQAWMNWNDFRDRRHRVNRYIHGDQWGDYVEVSPGKWMTERQRITEAIGAVPITANYMIKYFTTMKGLYSKNFVLPTCFARQENADEKSTIMTNALQTNYDNDNMMDILTQEYGEMLTGGMPIVCEEWCRVGADEEEDSHTFEVNPDYVGIEHGGNDSQMRNISLFVEIRDYLPEDLATELSNINGNVIKTYDEILSIYGKYLPHDNALERYTSEESTELSWDIARRGYCRTYRVWTLEKRLCLHVFDPMDKENPLTKILKSDKEQIAAIEAENAQRLAMGMSSGMQAVDIPLIEIDPKEFWDSYWYLTILAPDATVLVEMENPYEHGELPYTICAYEYADGDIIPFFHNIIPQQRNFNRLLTQKDTMVQRALKDLKMIPYDCVPPNMSPKQFAAQFTVIGGTVYYKPSKTGQMPQIISSNSADVGINDLLQMHKQGMEEITNITEALQGQTPTNGTAASRYAMETENSTTAIASINAKFNTFEKKVAEKKMKTIQQYYTDKRDVTPSQSNGMSDYAVYDPKEVGDIKYMIKITRGTNTPLARMQEDALADTLMQMGAISPEQRIELGWVPNKAKFLQVIGTNAEASKSAPVEESMSQEERKMSEAEELTRM